MGQFTIELLLLFCIQFACRLCCLNSVNDSLINLLIDDLQFFSSVLVEKRQGGAICDGTLEVIDGDVLSEYLACQLFLGSIDQRSASEAKELGSRYGLAHVECQTAVLGPVGLI